jgi:hypothetical protein
VTPRISAASEAAGSMRNISAAIFASRCMKFLLFFMPALYACRFPVRWVSASQPLPAIHRIGDIFLYISIDAVRRERQLRSDLVIFNFKADIFGMGRT